MDWHTPSVLSWERSKTLDSEFCVEASEAELLVGPHSDIFNTD